MEKTKVTIGVCVRNGESTIADALESIFAQDYSHKIMELLVVDDGSKDKTLSIIKKNVEKTDIPSKVFHQEWRGLGYSRNVVVDNAGGDYIIWVDGDMVLCRDYVRKQVEYLDRNPRVGLSLGFMLMPKDALLVRMDLLPFITDRVNFFKRGANIRRAPTGGTAFRVEALRQVNGFDLNLKGAGEDVDVAFRMQKVGWLFGAVDARFLERKGDLRTFGEYWRKHVWYGYGAHQVYLKDRKAMDPIRMNPLAGFLAGVIFAFEGYKLTRQKGLFFYLPVTFVFKRIAWSFGFNQSHSALLFGNLAPLELNAKYLLDEATCFPENDHELVDQIRPLMVTIGLCTKNVKATIREAIESVFNQDFPRAFIELIIVDGCSTDGTVQVIKDVLSKSSVSHKVFSENDGLGPARQIVVDNAGGDYIIWVDGDMVLCRDYVRKQVEYLDRNPKVGLSMGLMLMPKDALLVRMDLLPFIMDQINFFERGSPITRVATNGTAFRVEALRQVNGFDLNLKGAGEDVDVAFRMQKVGWLFGAVDARFLERKGDFRTFGEYWRKHVWYGYGAHQVYLKDRKAMDPIRMNPLAGFLAGVIFAFEGYKLTRQKGLFFYLPVTFVFKRIAWSVGFNKSHSKFLLKK